MSIRFTLFYCFFFFLSLGGFSQYTVEIKVDSMQMPKGYLLAFHGAEPKLPLLDSARADKGIMRFKLPEDAHPGMYRIVMGPRTWLDIIFNRENINLHTHLSAPLDSLKVIESLENKLFAEYLNFFSVLNRKQRALTNLMSLYPVGGAFYNTLEKEFLNLQQTDPDEVGRNIIEQYPETYIGRFLKIEQNPKVPVGLSIQEELNYVIDNYFELSNFTQEDMIYSPPLISKVQRYLGLIQQAFPPQKVEQELISGIDRVLSLAAINDAVYEFLLEELTRLLERSEFETLFAYFTENYLLGASCTDESKSKELAEILASIKKTALGATVPDIIIPNPNGPIILSELPAKYILVVFWASWCPHCTEMIPALKPIYQEFRPKGFEVVAISLDEEKQAFENALKSGQYSWINYSELKGWDCSIAYDYGIRATPTFILLDANLKVVGKPTKPQAILALLQDLL